MLEQQTWIKVEGGKGAKGTYKKGHEIVKYT